MYELVLRTFDKHVDACGIIKKAIGKYSLHSFYGKKLDTKNEETHMFVCEIEAKNRVENKLSLNPYANVFPPHLIVSTTILVCKKSDSVEVSLIVSSDDGKLVNETFVPELVENGFKIKEKNV